MVPVHTPSYQPPLSRRWGSLRLNLMTFETPARIHVPWYECLLSLPSYYHVRKF